MSPGTRPWKAARSFAAFSAVLAASAACSSGDADAFPAISGEVGEAPSVDFSEAPGFNGVERLVVTEGTGDDLVVSHQAVYEWRSDRTAREAYSSYGGDPLFLPLPSLARNGSRGGGGARRRGRRRAPGPGLSPSHPPMAQDREVGGKATTRPPRSSSTT